jgi:putative effector of murein hydrolase
MKLREHPTLLAFIIVFTGLCVQACSSGSQTTQTTVTRNAAPPQYAYASSEPLDPQPSDTITTTTTTTTKRPDSLLGATAHAVGTAIALPFRIVGDALGLIF